MDQQIYRITLVLTGLVNLGMAAYLLRHTNRYVKYPTYRMTRILTVVWLCAFAVGYLIHSTCNWRVTWPTAASALTATYFHIGALCFSWGYTSLLNPSYLKKKVIVRDLAIYVVGLVGYWLVAFRWLAAPVYTLLSYCVFFTYAVFAVIVFYRTYNRVSYRMMKMSFGSVSSFVRWLQVCCDLIILFGISSVAITGMFPNGKWPYVVLLLMGVGMFGYIVYSLEKYGAVIDDATRATSKANTMMGEHRDASSSSHFFLALLAVCTPLALTACNGHLPAKPQSSEVVGMVNTATQTQDQRFVGIVLAFFLVVFGFCLFIYFRHQAAMRLEAAYHELEIANARAEESSRIKSEFIQQISHEIRTPLHILSGFTQIITAPDMELDAASRADINHQIVENTNRITRLVNKMLELSDARSQAVIEQTDNVAAIQVAAEAVEASGIASAAHLTFDMQVSPSSESAMLHTNHRAVVRALSFILDNARKFTAPAGALDADAQPNGQPRQRAVLRLQTSDHIAQFVVEDTGIGIPDEESERIFDEFVQLDTNYEGTGIGLTIARSMARRLGGDVVLDTSYTGGARFVLTLPVNG